MATTLKINCQTQETTQETYTPPPEPVPHAVTRYQFKAALRGLNASKAAQLKAYIITLPEAQQEEWNERRIFFRNSTLINNAATALSVSSNAVDQLFRDAAAIDD